VNAVLQVTNIMCIVTCAVLNRTSVRAGNAASVTTMTCVMSAITATSTTSLTSSGALISPHRKGLPHARVVFCYRHMCTHVRTSQNYCSSFTIPSVTVP